MSTKKFKVAIWCVNQPQAGDVTLQLFTNLPIYVYAIPSGGGIGGLTCAVALSKYPDIDVDVYEAGTSFTQNGPGCGVWLRTWDVLQKLGLDHDLARIAGTQPTGDLG
jgi:hypothetical protein